jgi:bifunctional DNA-binding transcriptional regulator/antitoxin component of YhaV-PrlF toxin-antitoxin module
MQTLPSVTSHATNREFIGSVSPKGQITLPLDVRKQLGITNTVIIRVDEGAIKVFPTNATFLDSFQAIPALKQPLSFAKIRRIAREDHVKEVTHSDD